MSIEIMRHSIVSKAKAAFEKGSFLEALYLYRKLSTQIGAASFSANIQLCEQRLKASGRRECNKLQLGDIKVACIMDEFTFHSYAPECKLFPLTPDNSINQLESFVPDLLFVESAWRGKDGLWDRKISNVSQELRGVLGWCKARYIPTVFWNKEDPVHFETFLTTAKQFDFVFTTDIDCIARYKAALGHERVYLLPFACQPKANNPIEIYNRKDAFCFAGAYYVRYPERTRDLETYVAEFPKFKPLEIYDRNYGKADTNYIFPEDYQPYIVGTLPFNEIDKAYKGYKYSINLNSIKQSQSMFARRVYELLASNTITVSNFSRGLRLMFGDLVISSDSGKEIVERLQKLDDDDEAKLRLCGLRKVLQEHTYQQRFAYIAHKALALDVEIATPHVLVVALAKSIDQFQRLLASFENQQYINKKLVLVKDGEWFVEIKDTGSVTILTQQVAHETLLCSLLPVGSWLATMDSEDYYGPNYLTDLALATSFSDAKIIGKAELYRLHDGQVEVTGSGKAYCFCDSLPVRASLLEWDTVPKDESVELWLTKAPEQVLQNSCLGIDRFNYCHDGHCTQNLDLIKSKVNDPDLDQGLSISEIIKIAEDIEAQEFDESSLVKWNMRRFKVLFGEINTENIKFQYQETDLVIKSTLIDDKHQYIYAHDDIVLMDLPASNTMQTYLDTTPGLNVQYVFVFLSQSKDRIGHVIYQQNKNQTADIPFGTAFVRFGLRIYGSGEARIKSLEWGHRKHEPSLFIGKRDTLVLTNNYPSYDDLYRNAFVHSRVAAYAKRDLKVDVFRFRENSSAKFHEFEKVDVITGGGSALNKILTTGHYKSVLVHFLSPEMWQVLEKYPYIQVYVWVHGFEIHSWHRRLYNYNNEIDKQKALIESNRKLAFWRSILSPFPNNLKMIFVSNTFAQEVFEDLGFTLNKDSYTVIPNPIDTNLFDYREKSTNQRMRILSIRPYASRQYANDLTVRAILELSRRPIFEKLHFHIIGDGKLFDETLLPLRHFENIRIEKKFLPRNEIAQIHKDYGLFLVPTRWDSHGVSRDEAMSSGLVPITNSVAAIPEFVDCQSGILANPEDYMDLADGIERLALDQDLFIKMSKKASRTVRANRSEALIVKAELDYVTGALNE